MCGCVPAPSIKYLPLEERPRERLRHAGRKALSDTELVSLVLGGDLDCAQRLVSQFGGAWGLRRALPRELEQIRGIGGAKASQLIAAIELGVRSTFRREQRAGPGRTILRSPAQVAELLGEMGSLDQEELHALGLDTRHRLLGRFVVARGTANVVHVSPREIFQRLLREGAAALIIAHNHPSGDPAPSEEDAQLTERIRHAGDLVGIPLIDHLVVTSRGYHSFADMADRPQRRGHFE